MDIRIDPGTGDEENHNQTTATEEGEENDNNIQTMTCEPCNEPQANDIENPSSSSQPQQQSNMVEVDYFGIETDVRDRGTTCDICLLDYEIGDHVAWSPNMECSHTYHKDCVLDWYVDGRLHHSILHYFHLIPFLTNNIVLSYLYRTFWIQLFQAGKKTDVSKLQTQLSQRQKASKRVILLELGR
jgi:hypothetical protein